MGKKFLSYFCSVTENYFNTSTISHFSVPYIFTKKGQNKLTAELKVKKKY